MDSNNMYNEGSDEDNSIKNETPSSSEETIVYDSNDDNHKISTAAMIAKNEEGQRMMGITSGLVIGTTHNYHRNLQ